jgi:hypothetical protein
MPIASCELAQRVLERANTPDGHERNDRVDPIRRRDFSCELMTERRLGAVPRQ